MLENQQATNVKNWHQWSLEQMVTPKMVGILLLIIVLLGFSARNTEMDKAAYKTGEAVLAVVGLSQSTVLDGAASFVKQAFPFTIESRRSTNRIVDFDRDNLPMFSHIEVVEEQRYDALNETYTTETKEYLVTPFGYLWKVLVKMWETIEMGFWGTFLSVMISIPLAIFSAKNYSPNKFTYLGARFILSFHRAMPELIVALFFVLMYGFGPIAGIFALAMHTSGVLGKFFADEIENAPKGPQDALLSSGANKVQVLRYAVLPQVFPSYVGYVQYILERNIRTATVLGMVGAGGIGMELKGRWDMFAYSHVATILLVILTTVMILEYISQKIRAKSM
ncbi:MAG: phosphonate ABC transporter, permease protein PhnE [Gammaproteobacteria bacterium]|nr:phosphonate ABC transporter, permease protein PhnE [Gammaproteobacteria bacterium]MDT8371028.1 phosphonate ABC transporter, permease protein PhnE [Gammaproteobacteria bacterium]